MRRWVAFALAAATISLFACGEDGEELTPEMEEPGGSDEESDGD